MNDPVPSRSASARAPGVLALAAIALVLSASGCTVTHPRYAPELSRRWPDCLRLVVVPGTVTAEAKNYLADDYFQDEARGASFAQILGDAASAYLRDEGGREVRHEGEAVAALGGDRERVRAVADALLAHARRWMAHDAGYDDPMLHGLAPDTGAVPHELRRGFDAIVVVGGRARYESAHEAYHRYGEIVVRNILAFPLIVVSPIIPFALPASLAIILQGQGGYWQSAPNAAYFEVAVFDARTGRLLFANDWFQASPIVERNDFDAVAKDLLEKLAKVRAVDQAPLGAPPES